MKTIAIGAWEEEKEIPKPFERLLRTNKNKYRLR